MGIFRVIRAPLAGLVLALAQLGPAPARDWHGLDTPPPPPSGPEDYLSIIDHRPNTDLVIVWWQAPQMFGDRFSSIPDLPRTLARFVVITVVHGVKVAGVPSFVSDPAPTVVDATGRALPMVAQGDWPEALQTFVPMMRSAMITSFTDRAADDPPTKQAMMRSAAQSFQFYVFDNGGPADCVKGQLRVTFSGEIYSYDTPVPGCPPG